MDFATSGANVARTIVVVRDTDIDGRGADVAVFQFETSLGGQLSRKP
jgi:hypothetical protein